MSYQSNQKPQTRGQKIRIFLWSRKKSVASVTFIAFAIGWWLNMWWYAIPQERRALCLRRAHIVRADKMHHWCGKDPSEEALDFQCEIIKQYQQDVERYLAWRYWFSVDYDLKYEQEFLPYENWALIEMKLRINEPLSEDELIANAKRNETPERLVPPKAPIPQVASDQR